MSGTEAAHRRAIEQPDPRQNTKRRTARHGLVDGCAIAIDFCIHLYMMALKSCEHVDVTVEMPPAVRHGRIRLRPGMLRPMKLSAYLNNRSIRTKLVLIFTVATCLMFFTISALVLHTLKLSLSWSDNEFIDSRLLALRAIIDERPDFAEIIRKDLEWEIEYVSSPEYYVRLMDPVGRVILETPGMGHIAPPQEFPPPRTDRTRHGEDIRIRTPDNHYFLLRSDYEWSSIPQKDVTIQIALDVTYEQTLHAANSKRVGMTMIVGILASISIGWLVIRKIMRPLSKIVGFSAQVTVETIGERINTDNWPGELRRLADAINDMLQRLELGFARLSEYASNMAHEIRTPLGNIMGESEVALLKDRTPQEYRRVLGSVMEECARASKIIDNIMFLSRCDKPGTTLEMATFDAMELLEEVCDLFAPLVNERKATVTRHGFGTLYANASMFQRAVSNLLANSLHYSEPGVKIDLTVRQDEDGSLAVIVSDTGQGIREEDLACVFDRFHRGDRSHSNYPQGSGLGLSIVKSIMEFHHGTITIDSREGRGTTATLRFPRQSGPGRTD